MVEAEDEMTQAAEENENAEVSEVSEYFAQARLTRQESRDEALALLEMAATSESASQETIDSAMDAIAAMATYSMRETQIENLLIARNFSDCVAFISADAVTISVPAPVEGLSDADVAKIVDTITSETDFDATQIKVIEIKSGVAASDTADTIVSGDAEAADTAD